MPPISYSSLFPCAIAGLLVLLGELLKPAPEDRKFAFFLSVGKMLLHIAGGTVSRSVARKILKAVFDALELRRATLVAEKASYIVALCFMLVVVHTTEKKGAGFLSLLHVLAAIFLGIVQRERLRAVYDAVLIFVMLFLFDAALDAAAWAFSWVIILVKLVAVFLFVDRKLEVFFPTPPPYMDYQDTWGNGSRGMDHATPSVAAVGAYEDGTTLFTYINHKFDYAKNLKINYTRMRDEAEKLYARRDDYKHEANKHRGKQLKKECKIWIEEVGRIEVEMRELKSKYKNHRSAWHLFWSHSKLSKKFVHMWAKLRSTQEDGKFKGGIMVEKLPERAKKLHGPSPRERDDDFWIKSTKSEDSKSRVQKARKLSGGDTSKTNESGKSVAASLTLGNESTDGKRWHADRISINLSNNELSNLPDEPPMCPKLKLLVLQQNYKLRKIPSAFFTNMPILAFLDLSYTSIMLLPKSLFELPRLNELYLMKCEFLMVLPPEVGKLKSLEVLDMEGTEIINLPIEIKELSGLRRLRVSLYGCLDHDGKSRRQSNEMIPSGVISALSQLEEVSIDVNPDDERWDACVEHILNEVCGLARLSNLRFYIPRVEILSRLEWDHYATRIYHSKFKLIVGGHSKRIISRLPSNVEFQLNTRPWCLKYINGEGVTEVIKKVLQHATTFHLDRHMTARKLTEFGIENIDSLQYCVLGECNEMQVIIDGNDVHNHQIGREASSATWFKFDSLKFLYIYYMKNLKSIWEGPTHKRCLNGLKSLTLSTCPQLTTIFTVGLLESLCNLEELTVRDCPAIKSLVSCEDGAKQSTSYLPELRTISLYYLPNLVSISSEVCIAPKLEILSLYNCPKLKSLSIKEVSSKHLTKITGETDWWEALELTQVQHDKFDCIFVSTNADTSENRPTGNDLEMLMVLKKLRINLGGEATAKPSEGSVYHRKPMKKLFLLKGSTYDIDLADQKRFDLVSKGAHVTSYKCNAQQQDVFVKSINLEVPVIEKEFQQRMEDIGKVGHHPNIMLPFAYLFSETARYLLYDYAPAGSSLYAFLREPKSFRTRPHWDRCLMILLGAARGISHIHSQGGIIHGNIKSSNVIVTADYDGRISDFGLAPIMNIPELGAPELKETGEATQKSDVYNFGVMLSEIVNLYDNLWRHWLVSIEQVEIKQIIGKCKDRDPDRRPEMDEVIWLIEEVQSRPSDQTKTMKRKVVIEVSMDGPNFRSEAMKIAARFLGVESVVLQGEDKNQLVVTGERVDAVELTSLLRRNLGYAELISVRSVEEKKGGSEKQPMVWLPPKELEEKTQLFIEKCQEINMAMNVFGTPITNSTLEGMPEYLGKVITRKDRAHVALKMKNAGQKDYNAQQYVDNLKASYGNGVSTKCMIYNATGDDLTFVLSHDWNGHIGESPYPHTIQNGQWGAFLHVHSSGAAVGSSAAVVYSGLNNEGHGREWLLSWMTPWGSWYNNKAFAEVREAGHYYNDHWNYIYNLMENSKQAQTDSWGGSVSNATTGTGTNVYFVGIMTLENA